MQLLEVADDLSRSVDGVLDLQEVRDHWTDALIVLGEDSLEDREIVLCHLVRYLVEDLDEFGVDWILAHVEDWRLQTLRHHVVSVQDFLRQDDEHRVDLLVVEEPRVLQLKDFTHQQVFVPLIALLRILKQRDAVLVLVWHSLAEVRRRVEIDDPEALVGVGLDDGDVVLFYYVNFNSNCILGILVQILLEMYANHFAYLFLVLFVCAQEILNILVLREGELCIWQDWTVELEGVHLHWFGAGCFLRSALLALCCADAILDFDDDLWAVDDWGLGLLSNDRLRLLRELGGLLRFDLCLGPPLPLWLRLDSFHLLLARLEALVLAQLVPLLLLKYFEIGFLPRAFAIIVVSVGKGSLRKVAEDGLRRSHACGRVLRRHS